METRPRAPEAGWQGEQRPLKSPRQKHCVRSVSTIKQSQQN